MCISAIARTGNVTKYNNVTINPTGPTWSRAFTVFRTRRYTKSAFVVAVGRQSDVLRERLTLGDIADDVIGNDFIHRNDHTSYPAPIQ